MNSNTNKMRKLSIWLLILSILSIIFTMFYMTRVESRYPIHGLYEMINSTYVAFLFLPIPLISLVIGIIFYKKNLKFYRKNIITGIVISLVLLSIGAFKIFFGDTVSNDYSYVEDIENTIGFDLPSNGYISRAIGPNSNDENIKIKNFSQVTFFDENEIEKLIDNMNNSEIWTKDNINYARILGIAFEHTMKNYDYFLLYNFTTQTYNENITENGLYDIIYIAYSIELNEMFIFDYQIQIN